MSVFLRCWPGLAAIREQHSVPHGKLVAFIKIFKFTQSPSCTRKTLNSQTQDSLSVSLNAVGHVLFVKRQSQKKDVSPVIVPTYKEKLKYVKNVFCVNPLSFASTVQNAKQPEATANYKCLFFLDVGRAWRPSEDSIQSHMVSYCSAIK